MRTATCTKRWALLEAPKWDVRSPALGYAGCHSAILWSPRESPDLTHAGGRETLLFLAIFHKKGHGGWGSPLRFPTAWAAIRGEAAATQAFRGFGVQRPPGCDSGRGPRWGGGRRDARCGRWQGGVPDTGAMQGPPTGGVLGCDQIRGVGGVRNVRVAAREIWIFGWFLSSRIDLVSEPLCFSWTRARISCRS